MTFNYNFIEYNNKTGYITFEFDDRSKLSLKLDSKFPDYRPVPIDYYIDLNNGDIVHIPGGSKSMSSLRGPTKGWINQGGEYFRPLKQIDMDYDEVKNNRDNDNSRMYNYLKENYNEHSSKNKNS
jgi:hypothetical protein